MRLRVAVVGVTALAAAQAFVPCARPADRPRNTARAARGGDIQPAAASQAPKLALPGEADAAAAPAAAPLDVRSLTKALVAADGGLSDESLLADRFSYSSPGTGKLSKRRYLASLRQGNLREAFPDLV